MIAVLWDLHTSDSKEQIKILCEKNQWEGGIFSYYLGMYYLNIDSKIAEKYFQTAYDMKYRGAKKMLDAVRKLNKL